MAAYRDQLISDRGYLACEECGSNGSIQIHHICYKSEKPKHKNLHNPRNLIAVCMKCHDRLHSNKKLRNELIIKRRLEELFNCKLIIK